MGRRLQTCEVCDRQYEPNYSKQRTCGRACGWMISRSSRKAPTPKIKAIPPPNDCGWCGRPCTNHRRRYCSTLCQQAVHPYAHRQTEIAYGQCVECGILFIRRTAQLGSYCSETCSHRARKRDDKHRRKALVKTGDRITIRALGERDGWQCHICKRKVAADIRGNGPQAPSIDHLHPTSLGGEHVWSNVALAHRSCNGKRSNTGHAQLLLLA